MNHQVKPTSISRLLLALACAALASHFCLGVASAQGTAFTYQGRLTDNNGAPLTGQFDFRFELRTQPAIGGIISGLSPVEHDNVQVSSGIFTAVLDFGHGPFSGDRWLKIGVRPGAATGSYTDLTPRQRLRPAPIALALPNLWANAGNIGIGTSTPDSKLEVVDGIGIKRTVGELTKSYLNSGTVGMTIGITNAGVHPLGGIAFETSTTSTPVNRMQITEDGYVGIGTDTPVRALHVVAEAGNHFLWQAVFGGELDDGSNGTLGLGYSTGFDHGMIQSWNDGAGRGGTPLYINGNGGNVAIGGLSASAGLSVLGSLPDGFVVQEGVHIGGSQRAAIEMVASPGFESYIDFKATDTAGGDFGGRMIYHSVGDRISFDGLTSLAVTSGNVGIGTTTTPQKLTVAGNVQCTTAIITSDRNKKDGFEPVDAREVLDKVANMPITKWHYKTDSGTPHIGPVAQDFHEAFGLGQDNLHIATVDADGIALAAIQGLSQIVAEKDAKINALEERLEALETLLRSQ